MPFSDLNSTGWVIRFLPGSAPILFYLPSNERPIPFFDLNPTGRVFRCCFQNLVFKIWHGPLDSQSHFIPSNDGIISDWIRRAIYFSDRKVKIWTSESDRIITISDIKMWRYRVDVVPNLLKCPEPVWKSVPVPAIPLSPTYLTYESIRYRYWCRTELTEVSGTGINVVRNLPKCPVPVIRPVCLGTYRTVPNTPLHIYTGNGLISELKRISHNEISTFR